MARDGSLKTTQSIMRASYMAAIFLFVQKKLAVAQAVSRLRPGFRPVSGHVGIYGEQSDICAGFLRVLSLSPANSHSTNRSRYDRPISGRRTKWTQPHAHHNPAKVAFGQVSLVPVIMVSEAHESLTPRCEVGLTSQ
jgi:hypothetical protein